MATLSDKAIEVLRKIDEHGLHVLWSFKVPFPEYGQSYGFGADMPDEDWRIIEHELSKTERYEERGFLNERRIVERNILFANMRIKGIKSVIVERIEGDYRIREKSLVSILPEEVREFFNLKNEVIVYPGTIEMSSLNANIGNHVEVTSESIEIEGDEYRNQYNLWTSEWLECEYVPMDEWFEQNRGMIDRYTLTDAAKQLIAK